MNASTSEPRWATHGSQRRSRPISTLAQEAHKVVGATLEESAPLQGEPVVDQEHAPELDQTPQSLLRAVVRHEHEGIVGDPELEHARQVWIGLGNGLELLLQDAERRGTSTEGCVSLQA